MAKPKPRPRIDFDKTDVDVRVIVYFKAMGKAVKFTSKLIKKPPKGVVKI